MRHINLYDPELKRKRDWLALGNVLGGGALLLLVVIALGFATRSGIDALKAQSAASAEQLKGLRDQVTQLGQQVASRQPDPRIDQELTAARLMLTARGEVLKTLQQQMGPGANAYSEYLRGLARQNINGLRLVGFRYQGADGGMEIQGQTLNPALIPEYIRRLNKEPAFQGRAFSALQLAEGKTEPLTPPAATPAQTGAKRATHHEFKLIPMNPVAKEKGGAD